MKLLILVELLVIIKLVEPALISSFLHRLLDSIDGIPKQFDSKAHPDSHLSAEEIILKYGYPLETHFVITKDSYNLTVFRIQHGRYYSGPSKGPVFIQHGLLNSAHDWLLNSLENNLPFLLAEQGFDVFLGNSRETDYSTRNMNKIDPNNIQYWNFSFHEMGVYDLPAVIDYILAITQRPQLFYIGHSMGTTMFFVAMSELPEYNAKIKSMFALAPVAFLGAASSAARILTSLVDNKDYLYGLYSLFGQGQILNPSSILTRFNAIAPSFCSGIVAQIVCSNLIFPVTGPDKYQLTSAQISNFFGHFPSSTSVRTLTHGLQLAAKPGEFRQYDNGILGNQVAYGSRIPPSYDLKKITAPLYLYWGDSDALAAPWDVDLLQSKLPAASVKQVMKVDFPFFNHVDFLLGKDVATLVYSDVINNMNKLIS